MARILLALAVFFFAFDDAADCADGGSFLALSDIHFNPLDDPGLRDSLIRTDVDQWERILSGSKLSRLSKSGEDTNWSLFSSALAQIHDLKRKPKFAVVTGDLFAHHLREHFDQQPSPSVGFAAFAQKTALFVERELRTALPGIPVIISLGNNDGDCQDGDYTIEPHGVFLSKILPAVAEAAIVPPAAISDSWENFAGFDVPHPVLSRTRILVWNTTFLSARYRNVCGDKTEDPGAAMLAWLKKHVSEAQSRGESVWLVYHIPPGIDAYASTHPKAPNPERIVTMWKPHYLTEFESILEGSKGVVTIQLAGHTHFDDFRLIGKPEARVGFVLLNSGLSPNVGQNPSFREIDLRRDGTLSDLSNWYLPLPSAEGSGGSSEWTLEYRFRKQWNLNSIDLPNLLKLYFRIQNSPKTRLEWEGLYSVRSLGKSRMPPKDYAANSCAIGNGHEAEFRRCYCAVIPDAAFCSY